MDDHTAPLSNLRLSYPEALRYAASAVRKVNLLGPEGTELCTMLEIEALTIVATHSGLLPAPGQAPVNVPNPIFKSRRTKNV